jgi:hypothetical protein
MNLFREQAEQMIEALGYIEARRICIACRDMSAPGTATYAFHNAALKEVELICLDATPDEGWRT